MKLALCRPPCIEISPHVCAQLGEKQFFGLVKWEENEPKCTGQNSVKITFPDFAKYNSSAILIKTTAHYLNNR